MILTRDIVIYGAETLDLTPLVVQQLDQAAPEPAGDSPPEAKEKKVKGKGK